jgi:hypothetical protein
MVVVVVMPVVLCAKATEKRNKTLKLVVCYQKNKLSIYCKTYCNSYIANCSVVKPELRHGWCPNHFGPTDPGILGIAGKLESLRE